MSDTDSTGLCPVAVMAWLAEHKAKEFKKWKADARAAEKKSERGKVALRTIQNWTAGKHKISPTQLERIIERFKVPIKELTKRCCKYGPNPESSDGKPCVELVAAASSNTDQADCGVRMTPVSDGTLTSQSILVTSVEPTRASEPAAPMASTNDLGKVIKAPWGGVELVCIPRGSFWMGAPDDDQEGGLGRARPTRYVELATFYLAISPVTNRQYREYMEANRNVRHPLYWRDTKYNCDDQPVVGVSWEDAESYCKWCGLVLPTEAQWEYACRAGKTTRFWSGGTEADLERVAWYRKNSGGRPKEVGRTPMNPYGLYDMHGNVEEWCQDTSSESYQYAQFREGDGLREDALQISRQRITRGGSWGSEMRATRADYRYSRPKDDRSCTVGFRPALLESPIT